MNRFARKIWAIGLVLLIPIQMSPFSLEEIVRYSNDALPGDEYGLNLTTDKYRYGIGENVTITIRNKGNHTLYWPGYPVNWVIFDDNHNLVRMAGPSLYLVIIPLGPGDSTNVAWNQTYRTYNESFELVPPNGEQVPAGVYHANTTIYCEDCGEDVISLNGTVEFIIGEEAMPPVADAGPDQTVFENSIVNLNGSSSQGSKGLTIFGKNLMVNSEAPGSESGSKQFLNIAVDGKGVLHVFWCQIIAGKGRFVFYARSKDQGHTFEQRLVANKSLGGSIVHCNLQAEVDSNDFIHVMWLDPSDLDNYLIYHSVSTDGGDTFSLPTPLDYGNYTMNGNMEVDSNGIIHAVIYEMKNNLFHIKSEDGGVSFSDPTRINDVEGTCGNGWIAVDLNGNVHAVYLDYRRFPSKAHDLYYSISTDGGTTFKEGVLILEGDGIVHPMLVVDSKGNLHVVWREYGGLKDAIYYSMSLDNGDSFQPKVKIAENDRLQPPRMAIGHDNLPQIVWSEWGGIPRFHSTNYTKMIENGSFQSTVSVNDGGSLPMNYGANIDVDSNGTAHVVLVDDRNGKYESDIFYARSTLGHARIESYEWDVNNYFDSDGDGNLTNDVDATGPTPSWTYGDDGAYTVTLNVTDETGKWDTDTVNMTVLNVNPSILDLSSWTESVNASILFRITGEKWHNVEFLLFEDGTEIGYANITRCPGSPNDQMVSPADFPIDFSKTYSAIAYYTPEDDPINGQIWGATPAWFILRFDDEERRIHHTFNVRHKDTWVWHIEYMNQYFPLPTVTLETTAYDPGSDDLTFTWNWGDRTTTEHIYYNNGMGPDPYPSPDLNPISITDAAKHTYASGGSYAIILTVMDDDGGITSYSISWTI